MNECLGMCDVVCLQKHLITEANVLLLPRVSGHDYFVRNAKWNGELARPRGDNDKLQMKDFEWNLLKCAIVI